MSWRGGNPLLGFWYQMSLNPTVAEAAVEPAIAALGEPYRFQYPFLGIKYFADFALLDRKLIIEVDGDSHDDPAQKEKDLLHEMQVLSLGWNVARITNWDAMRKPTEAIQAALTVKFPDKESQAQLLKERLLQLYQNYPGLLAAAAKQATRRSQAGKAGAETRAAQRRTKIRANKAAPKPLSQQRARVRAH